MIARIVSGGQTGADRAALDFAIRHGIPHAGWCPRGRLAEDGPIPGRYALRETPSPAYAQRTEWNARDADGTVVLTLGLEATGGSLATIAFAKRHRRPWLHLSRAREGESAPRRLRRFVEERGIATLNVAGSRESREPGVGRWVLEVLAAALAPDAASGTSAKCP